MSTDGCQGLPHLCCNCRTCTHRRMTSGFTQVWGRNVRQDREDIPECPGWVIDMQARGSLYILWRKIGIPEWYVQKSTLDGEVLWNIQIIPDDANDFDGHRIDSDDTTVWVCARTPEFTTQRGLFAFSADDGSYLWSHIYPHYDVDPDGGGGCVVAVWAPPAGCSNSGTDTVLGNVLHLDSNGDRILGFGILQRAQSVLVQGTKVWVGAITSDYITCFCDSVEAGIRGSVARHELSTGQVELICAGGEWTEDGTTGCKVQTPIVGFDAYVTRLIASSGGNILCGVYGAGPYDCMLFELNASTGAFIASWDVSYIRGLPYSINSVIAMAVAGGETYVVVSAGDRGGLLLSFGGLAKRHKGYMKDLWPDPEYIIEGGYSAITDTGSDIVIGGSYAGCALYDDTVSPAGIMAGDCDQPCECGDFNTRGQAVVGCGCEDGVDPTCEAYLNLNFTGCLAEFSGVLPLNYYLCPEGTCYDCPTGAHHWYGSSTAINYPWGEENTSLVDCERLDEEGEPTGEHSTCCASLSMAVDVCYDCESGWILKFCVTITSSTGGYSGQFVFTGVIEEASCSPPGFTFTWDGTADSQTGTAGDFLEDCCGGTAGCGGFLREGCGIMICCDEPFPTSLTATLSAPSCAALHGVTVPLTYMGVSGTVHTWEGTLTIAGCGECTFQFAINNGIACEYSMGIKRNDLDIVVWGAFDASGDLGSIDCPFVSAEFTGPIPDCASAMDCTGDLTGLVA